MGLSRSRRLTALGMFVALALPLAACGSDPKEESAKAKEPTTESSSPSTSPTPSDTPTPTPEPTVTETEEAPPAFDEGQVFTYTATLKHGDGWTGTLDFEIDTGLGFSKDVENDKPGEASITVGISLNYATFTNDSDRDAAAAMAGFGLVAVYPANSAVCTTDLSPSTRQFNAPDPSVRPITLNDKPFCGVLLGGVTNGYGLGEDYTFTAGAIAEHVQETVVDQLLPALNQPVTVIGDVDGRNNFMDWRTVDGQCRLSYPDTGYDFHSPVLPGAGESCP